jgi:MFS family permease
MDIISAIVPATVSAAAVGVSATIILDCVMTFFGSAANDACFNAWLTDSTDETNRGAAEGINSMMPLVAILVVFGGFMWFDQSLPGTWVLIFGIIGTVVTALGVVGFFLIEESTVKTEGNENYFANIFYGFRPSVIKSNKMLYLTVAAVAAFNISIQVFMPYLIIYYEKSLGMTDYVLIFAPAIILAAVFTGLYGQVYDKKGFRTAIVLPMALLMVGYVLLYFFRATVPVFVGSVLMMCGFLGTGAILGAKVRTHTPENRSGMFQGLRIVGQVLIPGVIGPYIGKLILRNAEMITNSDGTQSFLPNADIFLGAFVAILFAWLVMIPLMKKK